MSLTELQAGFYQTLSKTLIGLKAGETGALSLFFLSAFLYGVLHAAGPGHGKAVISSYLLATGDTLKRGLMLTWVSSLLQGVTALVFTGAAVWVFGATARQMRVGLSVVDFIFAVSMVFLGIHLLYRRFKAVNRDDCVHIPPAEQLALQRHWRDDLALIFTIAIRPCTGAVFILVFAFAQGLWLYGVVAVMLTAIGTAMTVSLLAFVAVYMKKVAVKLAANGSSLGLLIFKSIEILAAITLILFGILLLSGMISYEKFGGLR